MTPQYIDQLANHVDPDSLWKLSYYEQRELPTEKRRQLDAGVALRRYAAHVRELRGLLNSGQSLLLTPLATNSTDHRTVPTPREVKG